MLIRHYYKDAKDEDQVMDLLEEMRGSSSADLTFHLTDSDTYKKSYLVSKNYIMLVAKIDNKIVGFVLAEHMTNDIVNLLMLYILKDHRRKGIAFKLKQALVELATNRGYERIVSQVTLMNEASKELNKKSGWRWELDKVYPDYYVWFTKYLEA